MSKIIETYLQGNRHKMTGDPCEDRTFGKIENGVTAIALADGAGSNEYSHSAQGAACVTKLMCDLMTVKFDKVFETPDSELPSIVSQICQDALEKEAEKLNLDSIIRLSSTMLCVGVRGDDVITFHIGDGVIGRLKSDSTEVLSKPENGEYASTTYFITLSNAEEKLRISRFKREKDDIAYFLMSDGAEEYLYKGNDNSFYDAAGKMAMLVFDPDGQEKLKQTVQELLIDRDEISDDCSFIVAGFEDAYKDIHNDTTDDNKVIDDEKSVVEKPEEALSKDKVTEYSNQSARTECAKESRKKLDNKNIVLIVLCAILLAVSVALAVKTTSLKHELKTINYTVTTVKEKSTSKDTTSVEKTTVKQTTEKITQSTTKEVVSKNKSYKGEKKGKSEVSTTKDKTPLRDSGQSQTTQKTIKKK